MASTTVYKILGAITTAATNTVLYTVPVSSQAVISTIVACNAGSTASTFRIALTPATTATLKDYVYYDVAISAADSFQSTAGYTLSSANSIVVYGASTGIVFSAYGSELQVV